MRLEFDRGTVVCRPAGEPPRAAPCEAFVWDHRVGAWRAPASRHAEIAQALEGVEGGLDDRVRRPFDDGVRLAPPDLRPYQDAALLAWEAAGRRGVVVLPTGSGKTRVAVAAIGRSRLSALCLVPTRVLLAQWAHTLGLACEGSVGVLGDGERTLRPVTVATYESAARHMAEIGNRFDLLVVDEAHHFGGPGRDEILDMATAPARLGLTATPPRVDARGTLTQSVGPVVFALTIGDLAGTFLAPFDHVIFKLGLSLEERRLHNASTAAYRPVVQAFFRDHPGAPWSGFVARARRTPEGREALAALRRARRLLGYTEAKRRTVGMLLRRHPGSRIIVFTGDNATAYAIAREHLVMPITAEIGRAERAAALEAFREGRLDALVSSQVLNEGLDVPDADVAIVVGGALGERELVQRIGRVLRPRPEKRALVYELVCADTGEVARSRRNRRGLSVARASGIATAR